MKTFSRMKDVKKIFGLSRTVIYARMHAGLLTKQVRLGSRAVGWPAHEIEMIADAFVAGLSNDEIKLLVAQLHSGRKAGDHV